MGVTASTSLSPAPVRWGPSAIQLAWGSGEKGHCSGAQAGSAPCHWPRVEQPRYQACQHCWKPRRPRSVGTSWNLQRHHGGLAGCRRVLPDGSQVKATQVLGTAEVLAQRRQPGEAFRARRSARSHSLRYRADRVLRLPRGLSTQSSSEWAAHRPSSSSPGAGCMLSWGPSPGSLLSREFERRTWRLMCQ